MCMLCSWRFKVLAPSLFQFKHLSARLTEAQMTILPRLREHDVPYHSAIRCVANALHESHYCFLFSSINWPALYTQLSWQGGIKEHPEISCLSTSYIILPVFYLTRVFTCFRYSIIFVSFCIKFIHCQKEVDVVTVTMVLKPWAWHFRRRHLGFWLLPSFIATRSDTRCWS